MQAALAAILANQIAYVFVAKEAVQLGSWLVKFGITQGVETTKSAFGVAYADTKGAVGVLYADGWGAHRQAKNAELGRLAATAEMALKQPCGDTQVLPAWLTSQSVNEANQVLRIDTAALHAESISVRQLVHTWRMIQEDTSGNTAEFVHALAQRVDAMEEAKRRMPPGLAFDLLAKVRAVDEEAVRTRFVDLAASFMRGDCDSANLMRWASAELSQFTPAMAVAFDVIHFEGMLALDVKDHHSLRLLHGFDDLEVLGFANLVMCSVRTRKKDHTLIARIPSGPGGETGPRLWLNSKVMRQYYATVKAIRLRRALGSKTEESPLPLLGERDFRAAVAGAYEHTVEELRWWEPWDEEMEDGELGHPMPDPGFWD